MKFLPEAEPHTSEGYEEGWKMILIGLSINHHRRHHYQNVSKSGGAGVRGEQDQDEAESAFNTDH